ncbi:Atu4866 domain-containing protein [Rhizobium tumorigenes]|nr:Atu4866 domain-containing protein [Rhizobium tumorigenes]WFS01460.1 Atu4866 domain-containing protein [Rhizobium tumorigenes]
MTTDPSLNKEVRTMPHPHVGLWMTADGLIRHRLLADNRYDEARGQRESAYRGRYEVSGTHIEYWDDTGFTADGDFIDGVLHHAGMVLYRTG